jgi:membrane protein implicated in regulation of membrane protease activity
MLFVVVAIAYNKLPIMQSTISIVISGALILVAELLTGGIMSVAFGMERFNEIMNYDITKNTVQEATLRAVCGIPMNVLFFVIALVFCLLLKKYREKAAAAKNEQETQ